MLKTTNKKVVKRIREYIIGSYNDDFREYDDYKETTDFKVIAKFILSVCQREKSYANKPLSYRVFEDWMGGLPALNAMYYYNVSATDFLGDWLEESEEERAKYTDEQACSMITKLLWRELLNGAY